MTSPFTIAFPEPLPAERRGEHWWLAEEVEVRLSNLDKVYWPHEGFTKGDLLAYYWNVAPHLLPHVRRRPLTLKRMPDGVAGDHFYQKDAPDHTPDWMPRCAIEPEDGDIDEMLVADTRAQVLYVANLGAIEFHPLHARCDAYGVPDYLVFDLDPFDPAGFEETLAVARHVAAALEVLALDGYPKTSGATGIQIYVPVERRYTFEHTRQLSERLGRMIVEADPALATMEWSIPARAGKVFIDHNMNRRGASLAAAYSVRPEPGAPVSTPLEWGEVKSGEVSPGMFTMATIFERLAARGDLFEPVAGGGQDLDGALAKLGVDLPPAEPVEERPAPAAAAPAAVDRAVTVEGSKEQAESEYDRKRRFDESPEPPAEHVSGDVDPSTAPVGPSFVIQQHHATALHHDVRLEMLNGDTPVLVSWAVPKGLPRRKGDRHLAIRTEDHPMEYATFSGAIPEGNYGAGEVRIFDAGTYEMLDRDDSKLTVRLEGERQSGVWHLIHTGHRDGKDQWLAILSRDDRPPSDERPAADPMLATLTAEPFDDPEWAFEPKWDGIRAIAVCDDTTTLISRNHRDISDGYPDLRRLHDQVAALDAMLDGEIVAFENGMPSFQRLQSRMHVRDPRQLERLSASVPVTFMVFDILYLDGRDLTGLTYTERRERLEAVVVPSPRVQISPAVTGGGTALFATASEKGLEGIVAKRRSSRYTPGARSKAWLKVKTTFDADVVVAGWTEGTGGRSGRLGSLVMAVYDDGELRYVGNVGTGFDRAGLEDAADRLGRLAEVPAPFGADVLRGKPELRRSHWVEPALVAKVEYRQLTDAGRLRAPSFQGFREDKSPEECTFDQLGQMG